MEKFEKLKADIKNQSIELNSKINETKAQNIEKLNNIRQSFKHKIDELSYEYQRVLYVINDINDTIKRIKENNINSRIEYESKIINLEKEILNKEKINHNEINKEYMKKIEILEREKDAEIINNNNSIENNMEALNILKRNNRDINTKNIKLHGKISDKRKKYCNILTKINNNTIENKIVLNNINKYQNNLNNLKNSMSFIEKKYLDIINYDKYIFENNKKIISEQIYYKKELLADLEDKYTQQEIEYQELKASYDKLNEIITYNISKEVNNTITNFNA